MDGILQVETLKKLKEVDQHSLERRTGRMKDD